MAKLTSIARGGWRRRRRFSEAETFLEAANNERDFHAELSYRKAPLLLNIDAIAAIASLSAREEMQQITKKKGSNVNVPTQMDFKRHT